MTRNPLSTVASTLIAVAICAVILGMALGQPTLIAYVDSGSMEPTIDTGDGFIAVPDYLNRGYNEGDVVVFQDEDRGRLSTHRIVDETEDGYITRGDANPFTDQDDGTPPVTEDQIVAEALQINGWVPTIPYVETVATTISGTATAVIDGLFGLVGVGSVPTVPAVGIFFFAIGLLILMISVQFGGRGLPKRSYRRVRRPTNSIDSRHAVLIVLVIVLIPANAVMILPSGSVTISVDGNDVASEPQIQPGDPIRSSIAARNDGLIAQFIVIESSNEDVILSRSELQMAVGDTTEVTATAPAPPPGETFTTQITQYRYLHLLPASFLRTLHNIHPFFAWLSINIVIVLAVTCVAFGFLGFGRVRFRDRSRTTRNLK